MFTKNLENWNYELDFVNANVCVVAGLEIKELQQTAAASTATTASTISSQMLFAKLFS